MAPPPLSQATQLKSCFRQRKSCLKQDQPVEVCGTHMATSYGYALAPSAGAASPNTRRRNKRCIAFGRLEIHEFPIILGDNPSCSDGAPLTVGWTRVHHMVFDMEYYETYNPSEGRRRKDKMKLSVAERYQMYVMIVEGLMFLWSLIVTVFFTTLPRCAPMRWRPCDFLFACRLTDLLLAPADYWTKVTPWWILLGVHWRCWRRSKIEQIRIEIASGMEYTKQSKQLPKLFGRLPEEVLCWRSPLLKC